MCVSVSVSAVACHFCLLSVPFALSLSHTHYSTHSLSALQTAPSAAANCVCFIDFHSPTSFHSFLTILPLVASLALRGVNKNCNRFFFSYFFNYSAQTFNYFYSSFDLFLLPILSHFGLFNILYDDQNNNSKLEVQPILNSSFS